MTRLLSGTAFARRRRGQSLIPIDLPRDNAALLRT